MIDDGTGGIIAFRGAGEGSGLVLREGANFERGRIILKNNDHLDEIAFAGHDTNNDSADLNRGSSASAKIDPPIGRTGKMIAEERSNAAALQMRANHERDWIVFQAEEGEVLTTGWLYPLGDLWWNHVTTKVMVESPSLLPGD